MQIKNSLDQETIKKILKGALIAGTGGAGLYILGAIGTLDFGSTLTPLVAVIIPALVNLIREWMKGE